MKVLCVTRRCRPGRVGALVVISAMVLVGSSLGMAEPVRDEHVRAWSAPSIQLRIASRPGLGDARETRLSAALRTAVRAWQSPCRDLHIALGAPVNGVHGAERDGHNSVRVQQRVWCRAGWAKKGCYDRRELAMTTLYFREDAKHPRTPQAHAGQGKGPGPANRREIVEADIELNGVHYDWFGDRPQLSAPPAPLEAVLAHELGHVLGLGDSSSEPGAVMSAAAHRRGSVAGPSAAELAELCRIYPVGPGRNDGAPLQTAPTVRPFQCSLGVGRTRRSELAGAAALFIALVIPLRRLRFHRACRAL